MFDSISKIQLCPDTDESRYWRDVEDVCIQFLPEIQLGYVPGNAIVE